jgi:serine/threonine protein kinase
VYIGIPFFDENNISDLKLENILLDKAENVKLGDFGFTREYEPKKLLETWCGTYSYAAPEMIQGEKYSGEGYYSIIFTEISCGCMEYGCHSLHFIMW